LVAASASTLGSVREIDAQTEKLKKNSNEDLKPVIDRYSEQLKNIKAILYIGGLMLFVGVLQLKLLG
jgi:nitrogenase molybdenum-iron protein alpha/beta subunit